MATVGCLDTKLYQDAVCASGRTPLVPTDEGKQELMRLIHAIKSGDHGDAIAAGMEQVAQELVDNGAEVIIGGCTEIPIVFEGNGFPVPVVASTNVLARRTLALAKGLESLPDKN